MDKVTLLAHLEANAQAANKLMGEITQATAEALQEQAILKADKSASVSFTILTSGWVSDNTQPYRYYYDIAVKGITAKDRAEISLAPGSVEAATACGLCPTNETLADKIRVRAVSVPSAVISAECWIEKGKE